MFSNLPEFYDEPEIDRFDMEQHFAQYDAVPENFSPDLYSTQLGATGGISTQTLEDQAQQLDSSSMDTEEIQDAINKHYDQLDRLTVIYNHPATSLEDKLQASSMMLAIQNDIIRLMKEVTFEDASGTSSQGFLTTAERDYLAKTRISNSFDVGPTLHMRTTQTGAPQDLNQTTRIQEAFFPQRKVPGSNFMASTPVKLLHRMQLGVPSALDGTRGRRMARSADQINRLVQQQLSPILPTAAGNVLNRTQNIAGLYSTQNVPDLNRTQTILNTTQNIPDRRGTQVISDRRGTQVIPDRRGTQVIPNRRGTQTILNTTQTLPDRRLTQAIIAQRVDDINRLVGQGSLAPGVVRRGVQMTKEEEDRMFREYERAEADFTEPPVPISDESILRSALALQQAPPRFSDYRDVLPDLDQVEFFGPSTQEPMGSHDRVKINYRDLPSRIPLPLRLFADVVPEPQVPAAQPAIPEYRNRRFRTKKRRNPQGQAQGRWR